MADIKTLIPQREPIIMVDSFLGIEDGVSVTSFLVREDNIFVDGGVMSECGLMEHVAQSAAARVGSVYVEKGEKVPLGYIGSINNFSLVCHPKVGDTLRTEIRIIQEVMNISLIEAITTAGEREVASCRMKIFLDV